MTDNRPEAPVRAAIYCRISKDRTGEEKGVERQEKDCRALAKRLGWEVVALYVDNDISAYSGKYRPEYRAMLEAVRRGQITGLITWHPDRLHRRASELEKFLPLVEAHDLQVQTVMAGKYDLSTPTGRMNARIVGSVAQHEVEMTAKRIRNKKAQAAAEGRYRGGPRPYGYDKHGTKIRKREAAIVQEMCEGVLAGRSLRSLVADLEKRGVKTSRGKAWNPISLRAMLLRPRNAGLVAPKKARYGDLEVIAKAQWPALVDEDTWRAVYGILTDPSRRTQKDTRSRWIGSSAYRCGKCGGLMATSSVGGTASREGQKKHFYRCAEHGHVSVMCVPTDNYVRKVITHVLRDPRVASVLNPGEDDSTGADRERRTVLAARLEGFENDYADGKITGAQLHRATQRIEAELAEVDARLATGMTQSTASPIALANDPVQAFLDAPIDVQRSVMLTLMTVEIVPQPVSQRGPKWTPERLRITPAAGLDGVELPIPA